MRVRRILFCDDDPDIREIIEISLHLDPSFEVKACESAPELLASIVAWSPDLILLDVMMPGLDGPAALAMLRENPCTQSIPVVFMTARTQSYECQHFLALGAAGVIAKPFDPMALASLLTGFFRDGGAAPAGPDTFRRRLEADMEELLACRSEMENAIDSPSAFATAKDIAQRLVTTAGVCGYCAFCNVVGIVDAARTLEQAAANALSGRSGGETVSSRLDGLLTQIESHPPTGSVPAGIAGRSGWSTGRDAAVILKTIPNRHQPHGEEV
jgi:CheY-like chemotaxis protein